MYDPIVAMCFVLPGLIGTGEMTLSELKQQLQLVVSHQMMADEPAQTRRRISWYAEQLAQAMSTYGVDQTHNAGSTYGIVTASRLMASGFLIPTWDLPNWV